MAKKSRDELLDELLQGVTTQEAMFGPQGLLKALTGALLERALKAELEVHLQGEAQQAPSANRRNGYSKKTLRTEQGPIPLEIPRDRHSTFEPQIIPKHVTRVAGLDAKIIALYSRGASTRDIQAELEALYNVEVSPTLISQVTDAVHEEVKEWQNRPLDTKYAIVWLDALMVKMRDEGSVKNRAVYVAIGARLDGCKEVLGMWAQDHEGAKFWMRVLSELRHRGMQDVMIACCDGLKGFPAAIEAIYPQTTVQQCVVHQVRNSLSFVGWQQRKKVASALRHIYAAQNEAAARKQLEAFEQQWGAMYPMIGRSWRASWEQLTPFLALPAELRRLVYTTNTIESLNFQLRKVLKTKGHFPSEEAALKLLFLALRNIEKKWQAPPAFWKQAFVQLVLHFGEDRVLK